MPYGSLGVDFCVNVFVVQVLTELGIFCRTPDMSKMHHDGSSDLKEVAEVLKRIYGVCNLVLDTCSMTSLVVGLSLEDR
jgi:hypothetical protein